MADIYELARMLMGRGQSQGQSQPMTKPVGYQEPGQPTDPSMGTGLGAGAADAMQLYPVWQEQQISGETSLQFPEWLKQQGINNPIMPAGANATLGVRG